MSTRNGNQVVEHMLRTRLARQAADMAVEDWAGYPQPQSLRLEEILPTTTPTAEADSEAALIYKGFQTGHKIVAFVKLYKYEDSDRWGSVVVELSSSNEHITEGLASKRQHTKREFRVSWYGDPDFPRWCRVDQGPLVIPL